MSAAHTPGPWSESREGVRCATGFVAFTTCNPREVDASRLDGESWLDMRQRTEPERKALADEVSANARLIAAAPDLLEALQDAELALDSAGYTFHAKRCRAAIAKATGGEA